MPIDRDAALKLLDLQASVGPAEVERALLRRVSETEKHLANAASDALRVKYRRLLADLEEARTTLLVGPAGPTGGLSRTMIADLPVADAAYDSHAPAEPAFGPGLKPGQVLLDRYVVAEMIGAGGMGAVYRAHDRQRDKDIAIKLLLPRLVSSPQARERFLKEARLTSELSHPSIVTAYDVQQDGPHCLLTMELLTGGTLRARLEALAERRTPMPMDEALRIVAELGDALGYAHRRTLHLDLKPENVWLDEEGHAKIMDFGIARVLDDGTAGSTAGPVAGTPYYMAPEQLERGAAVDARADQYALAAMLYEMLVGRKPAGRAESARALRPEVPAAVSRAVDRALSRAPEARFPDVASFVRALQARSPLAGLADPRRAAIAGGVLAVVLVGAAVWAVVPGWLAGRAQQEQLRAEAARLQGEARSLLKMLEERRAEGRDATGAAVREADRLAEQLRGARTPEERASLWAAALRAQDAAATVTEVERRFRALIDGPDGLAAIGGHISVAEQALQAQDVATAATAFRAAVAALTRARDAPARLRDTVLGDRTRAVAGLAGVWGLPDCRTSSRWAVQDDRLQVQWPEQPLYEARVLQVDGAAISVVVMAPDSQAGHLYRYLRHDDGRLEVEDLALGRRATLRRCP